MKRKICQINFIYSLNLNREQKYNKDKMSVQSIDINEQIDRILSSNISNDILNNPTSSIVFSPNQKNLNINTQFKLSQSSVSKKSISRSQLDEDLYQKAEQILKLKQILESQLSNINQILKENQKLIQMNKKLKNELKNTKQEFNYVKQEFNCFKKQLYQKVNQFQNQQIIAKSKIMVKVSEIYQNNKLNFQQKKLRFEMFEIEDLKEISLTLQQTYRKESKYLKIFSNTSMSAKINCSSQKIKNNQFTQTTLQNNQIIEISLHQKQLKQLRQKIIQHQNQESILKIQINSLKSKLSSSKSKQISKRQNYLKQKPINSQFQCYSSVFLKSTISQEQDIEETIRNALYSPDNLFFQQLQESKYFGKVVDKKKNGKAIQQYKNGFRYQGNFLKDHRHGVGKLYYQDRIVYAGEWKLGKFLGKGILYFSLNINVQKIQGNFRAGVLYGNATLTFKSGLKLRQISTNNEVIFCQNKKQSEAFSVNNKN